MGQRARAVLVNEQVDRSFSGIAIDQGWPKLHAHGVIGKSDGMAHGGHLLEAFGKITLMPHGEIFELTDRPAMLKVVEREVVQRIAHAKMSSVQGCGHLLPLEAPQVVAQTIRDVAT